MSDNDFRAGQGWEAPSWWAMINKLRKYIQRIFSENTELKVTEKMIPGKSFMAIDLEDRRIEKKIDA